MQRLRIFPAAAALLLAASVTMGSVYVTVRAAATSSQEGEALTGFEPAEDIIVQDDSYDYSVVLGPDGSISGRVGTIAVPDGRLEDASGVLVRVIRNGSVEGSATTAADGTYSLTGLTAGVYSVIATGENTFAAFAFEALDATDNLPNGPMLETAAVSVSDLSSVGRILRAELGEGPEGDSSTDSLDLDVAAGTTGYASGISFQSVRIAPDGLLYGWARSLTSPRQPIDDLTVYFIRDDETVGAAEVAPDGRFVVGGLTPGIYSVVGVGATTGMFAVGVDVLGSTTASSDFESGYIPVSGFQANDVAIGIIPTSDVNSTNLDDMTNDQFSDEMETSENTSGDTGSTGSESQMVAQGSTPYGGPAPGGFPGGSGVPVGGGGAPGIGGGSGVLEAALIGGAIWAIIEATDDDDPASPSM